MFFVWHERALSDAHQVRDDNAKSEAAEAV